MKFFRVQYGFRRDDGMGVSTSTHFGSVDVEAETEEEARGRAVNAAYTKEERGGIVSHVQTHGAREITKSENAQRVEAVLAMIDRPEPGRQYRLTGASGTRCIANGDSWADSEVAD